MTELPEFDRPPLTEVIIAVQFEPLESMQSPQIGLFWSRMRDRFPTTEQHPPLEPAMESFGPPSPPRVQLSFSNSPPIPRTWFLNDTKSELVQIQTDRIVHNWRKVEDDDSYPRFEHVKEGFFRALDEFRKFLREESLGSFQPNQCEISYINHIETNHIWSAHNELGKVLTLWNPTIQEDSLPIVENFRIATQHLIFNEEGNPHGRLHISAQPAFHSKSSKPLLALTLTVRGAPAEPTDDSMMALIDKGREAIVLGFTSITTPAMHEFWGRKR